MKLDNDFSLTFPTARYLAATGPLATLGRGIAPDVHIPWTPAQLARDVELEEACKLLEAEQAEVALERTAWWRRAHMPAHAGCMDFSDNLALLPYSLSAPFLQAFAHSRHRMHSVALRRERESSRTSTSMGQARRQAPQPTHLSWSQVTRMRPT